MTALVDVLDECGTGLYMRNASANKNKGSEREATYEKGEKRKAAFMKKQVADVNHSSEAGAAL